jgi:hypothetical protein
MTSPPFGFFLCHVEIMTRDTHDNENEKLSFITLSAATRNAIEWLLNSDEKQNEERRDDRRSGNEDKRDTDQHHTYVDQRLKELAAFERQARGETIKRRKF